MGLIAALTLLAAGAVLAPAATVPAMAVPTDAGPTPGWLEVESAPATDSVADVWTAVRRQQAMAWLGDDAEAIQRWLDNPERQRFSLRFARVTVTEGPVAGMWQFFGEEGASAPRAAWRLALAAEPPYRLKAQLHCEPTDVDCASLRLQLRDLRSPPPPAGNARLWAEWLTIVAAEPCLPLPRHMPAPRFPITAEGDGVVELKLLVNRCGEVRYLGVDKSSGDRALDIAAFNGAQEWRLGPIADTIGWVRVPVRFAFPDEPSAPPPAD
jgi:TonB family protein